MPDTKHQRIRHTVLDRCFRDRGRKYFIEDLKEACIAEVYKKSGKEITLTDRTVRDDISNIESEYSVEIDRLYENRRVYYRYKDSSFSIKNQTLNDEEAKQLRETLITLRRFKGLPHFQWIDEIIARLETSFKMVSSDLPIIEFGQNLYLKGLEWISPIFEAINEEYSLLVSYQGAKMETAKVYDFSPHYLKQYNSRWFVLGLIKGKESITNFALDRIRFVRKSESNYTDGVIDYAEYLKDVVGVTLNDEPRVEVVMEVSNSLLPYIATKPIHDTQEISKHDDLNHLKIKVIPNYELESVVLSYGEGLKILEPESFKSRISNRIKKMYKNIL